MAIHEPDSHWWSDIHQTEIRLHQKRNRSFCILPPQYLHVESGRVAIARTLTKAFLVKVRGFFANQSPTASSVSCADPANAYMHACLAATFFCYVSPELYGLTATDGAGATQVNAHPGDDR